MVAPEKCFSEVIKSGETSMNTKRFRFTDKSVREIKPSTKRQYFHDSVETDLLLQVTPTGVKTFYLYKKIDGQPVRYKLGSDEMSVKKARQEAVKIRAQIMSGKNPQKARRELREESTLNQMFQKFMEEKKSHLSHNTYDGYQRMWDKDLKSILGNKKVSAVTTDNIKRLHKKFATKPYYANRCVMLIRAMFNFFIKDGTYKGTNPTKGVKLNKEEPRVRYMEHSEIERFFNALNDTPPSVSKDAIIMMLFTGARKGNVYRMKWDEIDMDAKIWRIPKTKTGKNQTVALADSAVSLLKDIQSDNPDEIYVFPSETSESGHIVDVKRAWRTLKKKANLKNFRLHDLRHTLATYMIAQGADAFMVQRALTHQSIKSTQVYVNLGVEHLREKLNETVNALQNIGKGSKKDG